MHRHFSRWILAVAIASAPAALAAATSPSIEGLARGWEACPQFICGAALFGGGFQGHVGGRPAGGLFAAAIRHGDLPDHLGDLAVVSGGHATIHTWRGKFKALVTGGAIHYIDGTRFCVEITLDFYDGAHGEAYFTGILDHGPFPPTIGGAITQLPLGCAALAS